MKEARPDVTVCQFWHIPWPNREVFRVCPWGEDILHGLLGNDLLGFHVQYHCNNFLDTVDRALESPPFNLIIHSSPFSDEIGEYYHWHVELIPKLTKVAGFEWGTGLYINPTAPEEAARVLREARI